MIEMTLFLALIVPARDVRPQYAQYNTAVDACWDGRRTSDWILKFTLDGNGYVFQTLKCVEGKSFQAIIVASQDYDFMKASEEAVKETDAEFCKKATEPWQVKAFCKATLTGEHKESTK